MDGWVGRANGEIMARIADRTQRVHIHAYGRVHVHVHVHLAVQVLDAADDLCEVAPRVALLELTAPDHAPEELTLVS